MAAFALPTNLVDSVRADHPVVLKVAWRHEEAIHEADGLRV